MSLRNLTRIVGTLALSLSFLLIGDTSAFAVINDTKCASGGCKLTETSLSWSGVAFTTTESLHTTGASSEYCSGEDSSGAVAWTVDIGDAGGASNYDNATYTLACGGSSSTDGVALTLKIGGVYNSCYSTEVHGCDFTGLTPPSSVCGTSTYTVAGSYASGVLAVRVTLEGSTAFPSGSLRIDAPDPGGDPTGTATMTITSAETVDGFPNTYYHSLPVTSISPLTARLTVLRSDATIVCHIAAIPLSTNAISANPQDTTGIDTTPPSGSNCGFSLNPLHYLKCLFWPSSSFQQWNDLKTTAETHPPLSIAIGGITFVTGALSPDDKTVNGCDPNTRDYGTTSLGVGDCTHAASQFSTDGLTNTGGSSSVVSFDFLVQADYFMQNNVWGEAVYGLCSAAIGFAFFWKIWNMISASFGGKGSAT